MLERDFGPVQASLGGEVDLAAARGNEGHVGFEQVDLRRLRMTVEQAIGLTERHRRQRVVLDRRDQISRILDMRRPHRGVGRREVEVKLGAPEPVERELSWAVTLALGVPANDRMDALVEKAGELGAAAIQPLVCERSVLRLSGERAEAKRAHWHGVAAAASEQSGRTRVSAVLPMQPLTAWLAGGRDAALKIVLSFDASAVSADVVFGDLDVDLDRAPAIVVLSGPEGGLTDGEERAAVAHGFRRVGLGPRVLRADTAPLALLAWLGLRPSQRR